MIENISFSERFRSKAHVFFHVYVPGVKLRFLDVESARFGARQKAGLLVNVGPELATLHDLHQNEQLVFVLLVKQNKLPRKNR